MDYFKFKKKGNIMIDIRNWIIILLMLFVSFDVIANSETSINVLTKVKDVTENVEKKYAVIKKYKGKVSFYSKKHQGRKTASGEIFDMNKFTAAHKRFKFGTILKIINPKTYKSVIVKVNDRGPFVQGRELDLSYAAAQQIGNTGIMNCIIEVLK